MTTEEWIAWRETGIGASESSAIFGTHTYMTKRDLWLLKTKQVPPKPISAFANAKGGVNETSVRARYSLQEGCDFQPRNAIHDTFPFIKASLDGYDNDTARAIEIKFVGAQYRDTLPAKALRMGEHWIQCQHQMLAAGLFFVDYLWSCDGVVYKVQRMLIDAEFQQELTLALVAFWNLVTTRTDPGYSDDDAKPITDELMQKYIKEYKKNLILGGYFNRNKEIRTIIKRLITHPRMEWNGVKVTLTKEGRLTVR